MARSGHAPEAPPSDPAPPSSPQDFEEFPEHRTHFFYLLQAATSQCFTAFLSIAPAQFKLILDSIIWAFKHTMRNVADTGPIRPAPSRLVAFFFFLNGVF